MARRICTTVAACVEWLRAGYPTGMPRTGHSALLALNGPMSLTQSQQACVTAELESKVIETTAVQVAITKATDRPPTPAQTAAMVLLLGQR